MLFLSEEMAWLVWLLGSWCWEIGTARDTAKRYLCEESFQFQWQSRLRDASACNSSCSCCMVATIVPLKVKASIFSLLMIQSIFDEISWRMYFCHIVPLKVCVSVPSSLLEPSHCRGSSRFHCHEYHQWDFIMGAFLSCLPCAVSVTELVPLKVSCPLLTVSSLM